MEVAKNGLININGKIVPPQEATISVFDRGFLFGDSVYEVIRTYNGKLSLWPLHFQRLCSSATKIGMTISFSCEQLTLEIEKTIDAMRALEESSQQEFFIRIIVTRGVGGFTMDFSNIGPSNLIIMVKQLPNYPKSWYQEGVKTILASIHRTSEDTVDPNIKSGNYLNNVMAYQEAFRQGAYDAIMLNHKGELAEATTSNLWLVKDGTLYTPPLKTGLLAGITRSCIISICQENAIPLCQAVLLPKDLFAADECFLSSSSKEIIPVTQVDQLLIGTGHPGSFTKKIATLYKEYIVKQNDEGKNCGR